MSSKHHYIPLHSNHTGAAYGLFADEFESTNSSNFSMTNNTKTAFNKSLQKRTESSKKKTKIERNPFMDSIGESST